MPLYKFKISNAKGVIAEQLVEGDSQADARRRLQRRGLTPLAFLGEGEQTVGDGRMSMGGVRAFDVLDFTDRLAPLVAAHIPLERSLGILADGMDKPAAAAVVNDLRKGLHEGRRLSQLIRDRGRLFPSMYASMVEAGEEAGALPLVLADLRRFLAETRELRNIILTASIYPAVILLVSVAVLGILLGVIVPKFATILRGSGQALAWSTELLLWLSNAAQRGWWVVPLLIIVAGLFVVQAQRGGRTQQWLDGVLLRIPIFRTFTLHANLSRMARTLAILMRSGVPLLEAVTIAAKVLQNSVIRKSFTGMGNDLRQGRRLSAALAGSPHVPKFMLSMLTTGEESGDVPIMLERVAERYENDLRSNIRRLLAIFEPAMIIFIAVVVASIVFIMFIALMDMTRLGPT